MEIESTFLPKRDETNWLFFDVGSTLVDESKVYEGRMREVAKSAGVSYEYVYETALTFYKENKNGDLETMKLLGVEKPKWRHSDEMLYNGARECVKEPGKKYKIGIIANQSKGTAERLENFGILTYIDLVIASAEEGVSKPDKRIFEIALERAGRRTENAVMIGDRIDNDIISAKQIGMKTIWVKQGFGRFWNITGENEKADYEVLNLSDILKLPLE